MESAAAKTSLSIAFGGRLFGFALLVTATLAVVLFVELRQQNSRDAERARAVDQIVALGPLARAADQAADRLEEYLIARHGGYTALEPRLRALQSGLRDGRKRVIDMQLARIENNRTVTSEMSQSLGHLRALLEFNSGPPGAREENEPTLELSELSPGSFQARDDAGDLTLRNLSRYLWLISAHVEGVAAINPAAPDAEQQLRDVFADATRSVGLSARQEAAVLWEFMLKAARDPSEFGLRTDANGQVTLNEVKASFVALREKARLPGLTADGRAERTESRLEQLRAVSVNAPGLGIPLPLDLSLRVAPFIVAGLCLIAALLFAASAATVRRTGYGAEVDLTFPFLGLRSEPGLASMGLAVIEWVLIVSPLVLLLFMAVLARDVSGALWLPVSGTVLLWLTMIRLRRALRDNAGPFVG